MLNSHCNNNDKNMKKKTLKEIMRLPRFEPRIYGFTDDRGIHYAMEVNRLNRQK